jgi:hypothetical protein
MKDSPPDTYELVQPQNESNLAIGGLEWTMISNNTSNHVMPANEKGNPVERKNFTPYQYQELSAWSGSTL